MTTTWHLLTGEYPPSSGGVGDYTRVLACELARRGEAIHVWSPSVPSNGQDGAIHLHALPDRFGVRSRQTLDSAWRALPGIVLLQYVPNALGAGGLNVPFCWWLRRIRGRQDIRVMFHEPYFYFSWNPAGNLRAAVQRLMARLLVEASRTVFLSTETWRRYLPPSSHSTVLPMPSTIPRSCDLEAAARFRERLPGVRPGSDRGQTGVRPGSIELVGHFGTYGDHVARELEPIVPLVLDARPSAHFVFIGRGSEAFAAALRGRCARFAARIHSTGPLSSMDAAAAIRACDVMVQPYPDGITTRRTSAMAAMTNGVATVSTTGDLTEPVWSDTKAIALAPATNARATAAQTIELLGNASLRAQLGESARRAYDAHFAIEESVGALLTSR